MAGDVRIDGQSVENPKDFSGTKDKVDYLCTELRRLARWLDSPVVVISSENRAGYNQSKLDAFKESGGIEYGADVAAVFVSEKTGKKAISGRSN